MQQRLGLGGVERDAALGAHHGAAQGGLGRGGAALMIAADAIPNLCASRPDAHAECERGFAAVASPVRPRVASDVAALEGQRRQPQITAIHTTAQAR